MSVETWRNAGCRLLGQAAAVRRAFPDRGAMARVAIDRRAWAAAGEMGGPAVAAALGCLLAEVLVVQGGGTDTLAVLDDEAENAARAIGRLAAPADPGPDVATPVVVTARTG